MAKKAKNNAPEEEVNWLKEIVGMVVYVAFVVLAVWLIITFVGQRTEVSGSSMYDTLENGDNLWVSKISYHLHDPERFDIVVFPHVEEDGEQVFYIKRIIGMPGETVRIDEEGTIYINDKVLEEEYGYETIEPAMIGRAYENVVLGEDEYFVMGDNRNDSKDSRFEEVGNIKREELEGKAVFRIWPFSKFGKVE
ncbi:MAG: signal peptidase I [Clostridiales bacterium]|nr:signal peptidase I [Clostridiales bacterium]